jgi:hypothetical protein
MVLDMTRWTPKLLMLKLTMLVIFWINQPTGWVSVAQQGDRLMPRQDRSSDQDATEKLNDSPGKDELVITPAGPVRRENVHPVSPNEVVRRGLDGRYMITPRTN